MSVGVLKVIIYEGPRWHSEDHFHPSWGDVEEAITRLDREAYPFIWLYRDSITPEDDYPDFYVMGGQGAFIFSVFLDGVERRYLNPNGGDHSIPVWVSDQGYEAEERYVCFDINVVLKATRYFFENGGLYPELTWE